jgi:chemotaxis signal transduction protein
MTALPSEALATRPDRAFYAFRSGGLLYGADLRQIQEVAPCPPITAAPQAPSSIRGLTNLRSHIYLALDMRALIGQPWAPLDGEARLVVVKQALAADLGLVVERGGDIVHVRSSQIEAPPAAGEHDGSVNLFPHVCRLDGELMTVLDLSVVASFVQARFAATARTAAAQRPPANTVRETTP